MYSGKDFEDDFKSSFPEELLPVLTRLYDTTNGFLGVKNPCDFIAYASPLQLCLELKVTQDNRLPFDNITEFQKTELSKRDKIPGILAGIVVCYYNQRRVFFTPMYVVNQIREKGLKSMHWKDAERYGIELELNWKRTRFTVNIESFFDECRRYTYDFKVTEVTRRG